MNFKLSLLILLFTANFTYSQKLSTEETLNYIEKIHNEHNKYKNHKSGLLVRTYFIDADGFLTITCYVGGFITSEDKVHINDISNKVEFIHDANSFRIKMNCKTRNCFKLTSNIDSYHNEYEFHIPQEYYAEKLYRAVKYFVSLINETPLDRDLDDPFSNKPMVVKPRKDFTENIRLSKLNGIYGINVQIDKIVKEFILDSGASETSISKNLEHELIKSNLVHKDDYLEYGLYKIADGSIITQKRLKIKNVIVGPYQIKELVVSVGNDKAPLLLGKNFLDLFNIWSIDNTSQTLKLIE